MIYPEIDAKIWSVRHGIELSSYPCFNCKKLVDVNIPIISKDFVGFESKNHGCGEEYKIILLKPRSQEIIDIFKGE
jgi:hypothetical protein